MKHLKKSLAVAALLASAGAANASIATGSNTNSELLLSVYDSSRALTFTLDLGVTMGQIVTVGTTPAFNNALNLSFDLNALTASSTGAQWSTFATGLNAATTKYGIVTAGTAGKILATGQDVSPAKFATATVAGSALTNITNHLNQVNTGAVADNAGTALGISAQNLSSIVADGDTQNTGQHNQALPFATLFGGKSDAFADVAYDQAAKFYFYNSGTSILSALQSWKLTGNTLTYAPAVAAVPLPAAVWLFGAGLMGMLRLNRRKGFSVAI